MIVSGPCGRTVRLRFSTLGWQFPGVGREAFVEAGLIHDVRGVLQRFHNDTAVVDTMLEVMNELFQDGTWAVPCYQISGPFSPIFIPIAAGQHVSTARENDLLDAVLDIDASLEKHKRVGIGLAFVFGNVATAGVHWDWLESSKATTRVLSLLRQHKKNLDTAFKLLHILQLLTKHGGLQRSTFSCLCPPPTQCPRPMCL